MLSLSSKSLIILLRKNTSYRCELQVKWTNEITLLFNGSGNKLQRHFEKFQRPATTC